MLECATCLDEITAWLLSNAPMASVFSLFLQENEETGFLDLWMKYVGRGGEMVCHLGLAFDTADEFLASRAEIKGYLKAR